MSCLIKSNYPESEFIEFDPYLKSAQIQFKLIAGLNLETLNTIISEPTIFEPRLKFKPWLKFFKFGLWKHLRYYPGNLENIISEKWKILSGKRGKY